MDDNCAAALATAWIPFRTLKANTTLRTTATKYDRTRTGERDASGHVSAMVSSFLYNFILVARGVAVHSASIASAWSKRDQFRGYNHMNRRAFYPKNRATMASVAARTSTTTALSTVVGCMSVMVSSTRLTLKLPRDAVQGRRACGAVVLHLTQDQVELQGCYTDTDPAR